MPRTNSHEEHGGAFEGETVLIDSEEPPSRRSKSLVDPRSWTSLLLDLPSLSVHTVNPSPLPFYEERSRVEILSLSLSLVSSKNPPPPLPSPHVSRLSREKNTRLEERGPRHTTRRHTPAVNIYPRLKSNEPPHLLAYLPVARVKFVPVIKG